MRKAQYAEARSMARTEPEASGAGHAPIAQSTGRYTDVCEACAAQWTHPNPKPKPKPNPSPKP